MLSAFEESVPLVNRAASLGNHAAFFSFAMVIALPTRVEHPTTSKSECPPPPDRTPQFAYLKNYKMIYILEPYERPYRVVVRKVVITVYETRTKSIIEILVLGNE